MKLFLLHLKSFLPRKLPIGMATYEAWLADIIELSGLPNNDSTRKVAAMFLLQAPPHVAYLPLRRVVALLIKTAANQVAANVVEQLKATTPIIASGVTSLGSKAVPAIKT
jgi:hypothetical protein